MIPREERVDAVRDAIKLVEQTKEQFTWSGGVDEAYYVNLAEAAIVVADATRPVTDAMIKAAIVAVQDLPMYVAEERFADRQWREIKAVLVAALKVTE